MFTRLRRGLLAVGLVAVLASLAISAVAPAVPLPPAFSAVRAGYRSSEARLLDRHGRVLHELRVDRTARRLAWTRLEAMSPALIEAVTHAEDRRFARHHGVDWIGVGAALWSNLTGGDVRRGASTITMQVAAQLNPELRPDGAQRSWRQKWAQMRAAQGIERRWRKAEILEAYLNLISFRGELQGIAAASLGLFGKQPDGLTAPEASVLAALIRAPNAAPDRLAARACQLRAELAADREPRRCDVERSLVDGVMRPPRIRQAVTMAPHVARQLLSADAREVSSSLDADLQRFATGLLRQQLEALRDRDVRDGAALVVDNVTGEVLAYVGNAGTNAAAGYVDGVQAMRQAGSTLKPFLYALAIDSRRLTAASLLDDAPVNLETPTGLYVPQNYDREFRGWVTARTALASSLNVPAVRTLMLVGVDDFTDTLRRFGFAGITQPGDYYGYSLSLGSAEVSLWQLVNAYRALANNGRVAPLTLRRGRPSAARPVVGEAAAYVVGDMLADRGARATTFGLDNPVALPFSASVKTGTSKDMRDNWCIGYTARYTVGVWVGNFDGQPMHDVSGVTGAAPVWADLMRYLHRGQSVAAPLPPAGVVRHHVAFTPAIEAPRDELFLAGTEMAAVELNRGRHRPARITYPGNGMVIAVDPDIPPARQRVFFAMQPADGGARWQLNGHDIDGDGWRPAAGDHALRLLDGNGTVLDSVRFVVRGGQSR